MYVGCDVDDMSKNDVDVDRDDTDAGKDDVDAGRDDADMGKSDVDTGKDSVDTGKDDADMGRDNANDLWLRCHEWTEMVHDINEHMQIRKDNWLYRYGVYDMDYGCSW